MLKRNIVLIFGVLIAFMFFFTPESHASFTVNGETYPDLPSEFINEHGTSYTFTSYDYFIYTEESGSTWLTIFALNDADVTSNFYMDGTTLKYKISKALSGWNFSKWHYKLNADGSSWGGASTWNAGSTARDNTSHGHGSMTFLVSSKDIYTDSKLDTLFFQKTPISNFQLHQIVGETVQKEIPKMATKIIQTMKVIVVFSISCLIFLILLVVFLKVFSIFRVKS